MPWLDVRVHVQQEEQPLLESTVQPSETREHKRLRSRMSLAMWTSLVANVLLLAAKIVAYMLSHSSAILASAADSFVDIASQVRSSGRHTQGDGSQPWHLHGTQCSWHAK